MSPGCSVDYTTISSGKTTLATKVFGQNQGVIYVFSGHFLLKFIFAIILSNNRDAHAESALVG